MGADLPAAPLARDWPCLWIDAAYLKVREAGRIVSVAAIIAVGANTERLTSALATIDVRVLDHFIVGKGSPFSFAEAGLL